MVALREAAERRFADLRHPVRVVGRELLRVQLLVDAAVDALDGAGDVTEQAVLLGLVDDAVLARLVLERRLQQADRRIAAEERRVEPGLAGRRRARVVVGQRRDHGCGRVGAAATDGVRGIGGRALVQASRLELAADGVDLAGDLVAVEEVADRGSRT